MNGLGEIAQKMMQPYANLILAPLLNKVVDYIAVSDDGTEIVFTIRDGEEVKYRVEGDCCSQSWVEHLTYPLGDDYRLGMTVLGYDESEGVETNERIKRGCTYPTDVVMVYQSKFITDKGDIVIEYRNDSNGYYGGWIEPA